LLPTNDKRYLEERAIPHSVSMDGGMVCVVMPKLALPHGLDRAQADLLVRLNPGYPDVPPDMWWFDPAIRKANGAVIPATDLVEHYMGRSWQRWSRHLPAGQWKSGTDGLESYLALVHRELKQATVCLAA
jgi:hypothetical protein